MYAVDEQDTLIRLSEFPRPDSGAPCPIIMAEEHRLVLAYWEIDDPPYEAPTAPLAVIRFERPYLHLFGPPTEESTAGHPLADRGLHPYSLFRVAHSSLVRHLMRMDSVHRCYDPRRFEPLVHYIFPLHDSTFECVAESYECRVENVGLNGEHARTLQLFREWNSPG